MRLQIKLNFESFFKLKNNNKKIIIKNNNLIEIKYIIYYVLLIEFINKKNNNQKIKVLISKPKVTKKNHKTPILYSPNRHKVAQKQFKLTYYNLCLPISINLLDLRRERILNTSREYLLRVFKSVSNLLSLGVVNINLSNVSIRLDTKTFISFK